MRNAYDGESRYLEVIKIGIVAFKISRMLVIMPYLAPARALIVVALTERKLKVSSVPFTWTDVYSKFSPGKTSFPIMRVNDTEPIRYPDKAMMSDVWISIHTIIS